MTSSLNALAVETDEPAELILEHPTTGQPIYDGDGKPASIMVLSFDSKIGRKHSYRASDSVLKARGKAKSENLDAGRVEMLADLTQGWHLVAPNGEVIDYEFSRKNAIDLYATPKYAWIRDQVDQFAGDRANFMQTSGNKSSSGQNTSSDSTPEAETGPATGNTSQV